jgi:outer membrane lipoprotein-sorting protein
MFRRSAFSLFVASLVLAGRPTVAAQSVDDLVARNIEAKGGAAKLQAVRSLKTTARMTSAGMDLGITIYFKRPNLMRQELSGGPRTMIIAFDGTTAWGVNPATGPSPMALTGRDAESAREQADPDGPLVDYKAKGHAVEFVATEMVAGRRAHHLKITTAAKRILHCYLDAETFLEMKIVSEAPTGPIEQELGDYRDVEGLKLPHSIRSGVGDRAIQIVIEKIEVNPTLDDAIFRMPRAGAPGQ